MPPIPLAPPQFRHCCFSFTHPLTVMDNFVCQLDRATVCPDIRSNIILGVSAELFLDEINDLIGRIKQIAFHNVSGLHPTSWRTEQNEKMAPLLNKREFTSRLPLDFIYNIGSSCLMAFELENGLSLGLQPDVPPYRLDLSTSIIMQAKS